MDKIELKSLKREATNASAKALRKAGRIPAVLYGHKLETTSISLDAREFEKVLRRAGESTIIELQTEDGKSHPVIVQDVQRHVVTHLPIHVDFYQVSMTEKMKASIPLEIVGESRAVKNLGGTLVRVLSEVEVECLPADLPHNIEVDISVLNNLDDSILIKDLKVSSKVKILAEPEETVAKVQPPRDVEAELAAPVVEDVSAVEGAAEEKPEAAEASEDKSDKE